MNLAGTELFTWLTPAYLDMNLYVIYKAGNFLTGKLLADQGRCSLRILH